MKVGQSDGTVRDEMVLTGSIPTGTAKIGKVQLESSSGIEPIIATLSDGLLNSNVLHVGARGIAYNGSSYDAWRNNLQGTLLASAARTATVSSSDQTNYNGRGTHIFLNVTSAGTGSITLKIEEKDPVSGNYVTLIEGVAITTNGITVYKVGQGLTAAANSIANDLVPRTWRVTITHNNANSITYSVGYALNL